MFFSCFHVFIFLIFLRSLLSLILLYCSLVIFLYCGFVIFLYCSFIIFLYCSFVIFLQCSFVIFLYCIAAFSVSQFVSVFYSQEKLERKRLIVHICIVLHRKITQLDGKREGADASSINLNLTDPVQYRASTTVEGCQAGEMGHLLQYYKCASTMPRAQNRQKKVQLSWKTKHFAHLGILFIYDL